MVRVWMRGVWERGRLKRGVVLMEEFLLVLDDEGIWVDGAELLVISGKHDSLDYPNGRGRGAFARKREIAYI
jgi:hypothetical protein